MKYFSTKFFSFASAFAIMHTPIAAQVDDAEVPTEEAESKRNDLHYFVLKMDLDERAVQRIQTNSTDAAFGVQPTRFNLQTDQDGETATISLGRSNSQLGGVFRTDYSVKLTAPFTKSVARGDLLTRTGLPDAYSVEGSISFKLREAPPLGELELFKESDLRTVNLAIQSIRARCTEAQADPKMQEKYKDIECDKDIKKIPVEFGRTTEVDRFFDEIENQYLESSYFALQLSGAIGVQAFDHRDSATLAEIKDDRTVASATASFVYLPTIKSGVAYIAGGEFERDFDLPDEEIRCPAGETTAPSVTCFTAAFGTPVLEEDITLFAGLRFISSDERLPIGGELRFAINPNNGEWGVEAPIYFLRSSKDELNAGVRIAYDSEMDDAFFGVFIGQNFGGLLGQ